MGINYVPGKWENGKTVIKAEHFEKIEKGIIDIINYNDSIYVDEDKRKENEIKREVEHNKKIKEIDSIVEDLNSDYDNLQNQIGDRLNSIDSQLSYKGNDYDISRLTDSKDITGAINELFTNVSNGKELIANAITDKGIETLASDTFEQMAENISAIGSSIVKDMLIFNLDARTNAGTTNTYITEEINGYNFSLLNNITLNPIQWEANGLRLRKDYQLSCNTSSLLDKINEYNGMTFEIIYNCQPRSLFIHGLNNYLSQGVGWNHYSFPYINTSDASASVSVYNHNVLEGQTSKLVDNKGYVHTFITYSKDGIGKIFHNGYETRTPLTATNYKCFNKSILNRLTIRANHADDVDNTVLFTCFRIYNKELNYNEMQNNIKYEQRQYLIQANDIKPTELKLKPYTKLNLVDDIKPSFIDKNKITKTYSIENESIINLDKNNCVVALNEGSTNISVNTTYKRTTVNTIVPVTVGDLGLELPAQTRTPNKLTLVNIPSKLYIGEEYALNGFLEPHHPFNDNLIKYISNDNYVCSVDYGVLKANNAGTAVITASDVDNKVSSSFSVTVVEKEDIILKNDEIYVVNLERYNISPYNSNSTETTNGIIDALKYASENNYKKIVFPYGAYLINPLLQQDSYPWNYVIRIPSNLIIDFSNSIINIEPQKTVINKGYHIFQFHNTQNSCIINANIYGDRYTSSLPTSSISEQCTSVEFVGAINCGLKKCTVGSSPGFNIKANRFIDNQWNVGKIYQDNIESGSYNDDGSKDDINVDFRWRTINKIDVSMLNNHFELGNVWGYGSYMIAGRVYDILFYDENENMISYMKDLAQFYRYDLPNGAKFANLVFHQEDKPTGQINSDVAWLISLYSLHEPYNCYIEDCVIKDNYSTGIAMCGGKNWRIKNNTFINNTGRDPSCHVDYEDGWDSMNGDIWTDNVFNGNSVLINAGNNLVFHNNYFDQCGLDVRTRSLNWRIYLNTFIAPKMLKLGTQSDALFSQNILHRAGYTKYSNYHGTDGGYKIHEYLL